MTKQCSKCKEVKSLSHFGVHKGNKDGLSCWCKHCRKTIEYNKRYANIEAYRNKVRAKHAANPRLRKSIDLKSLYGIDIEQYEQMLRNQNGVCAICKQLETAVHNKSKQTVELCVDHCHKTGKVRGLLCNHCNRAVGALKDNPILCYSAGDYLKSYFSSSLNL